MKINILGNCHVSQIAKLINSCPSLKLGKVLDVNVKSVPDYSKKVASALEAAQDNNSITLSHPLSQGFDSLSTEFLKINANKFFTISNINFSGLHPDITYMGGFLGRLRSALGDYHSRIVIVSFIRGDSYNKCIDNFNHKTYDSAGYFKEFELSAQELRRRDSNIDIKSADEFLSMVKDIPCMMTHNHPTMRAIEIQVQNICAYIGQKYSGYPSEYFANGLSSATWWPVYEEIKEFHGLKFNTPMFFKPGNATGPTVFWDLPTFVERCYALYSDQGREKIESCVQMKQIRKQFDFML